ncbi:BA3454 family stress response protein [Cytobacillus firmus]|nr:BA3454 family stress response protein [Cytobacillus firmus]
MIEVTIKLNYKSKYYLTNVIVNKNTPEEEILLIAKKQISNQWAS